MKQGDSVVWPRAFSTRPTRRRWPVSWPAGSRSRASAGSTRGCSRPVPPSITSLSPRSRRPAPGPATRRSGWPPRPVSLPTLGPFGGLLFVVAIIFIVMFHEFGHYITAKRFDMKVTEFFFGFGPRLWSVRRGETDYGIKPIPAGGYVKIVGMKPLEEIPPEEGSRTFRGKPAWQKLIVLVAGSTTHFITGLFLLVVVFAAIGVPGEPIPVLADVPHQEGQTSPAEAAGLRPGDRIVSVDGQTVSTWAEVSAFISEHPNAPARFGIQRGGQRLEVETVLSTREDGRGFLGVVASQRTERDALPVAAWHAVNDGWHIGADGMKGLVGFFAP